MNLMSYFSSTAGVSRRFCLHGTMCFYLYYYQTVEQRRWEQRLHDNKAASYTVHYVIINLLKRNKTFAEVNNICLKGGYSCHFSRIIHKTSFFLTGIQTITAFTFVIQLGSGEHSSSPAAQKAWC